MLARRLTIRGRVQGVGFRESMLAAACELVVTGWVRNRQDGSVEAWVQGETAAVMRAIDWCRRGPPAARVTGVESEDVEVNPALQDFSWQPTL